MSKKHSIFSLLSYVIEVSQVVTVQLLAATSQFPLFASGRGIWEPRLGRIKSWHEITSKETNVPLPGLGEHRPDRREIQRTVTAHVQSQLYLDIPIIKRGQKMHLIESPLTLWPCLLITINICSLFQTDNPSLLTLIRKYALISQRCLQNH